MRPARVDQAPPGVAPATLRLTDSLDSYLRAPGAGPRRRVRDALADLATAIGARGAYLELNPDHLPALAAGTGSVARRPGSRRRGSLFEQPIASASEDGPAGWIWFDASSPDMEAVAGQLGLVIRAATTRDAVRRAEARLAALDASTRAIAAVLDLDRVLQVIVDRVRELVDAEYAALAIVGEEDLIDRFITSGMSWEVREEIGAPPRGRGLLGVIVREGRSVRIPDILADPRAYGFPAHHPQMRSLLGVPVSVKGRAIGNLYLTDKRGGGEFTAADQELVEAFARHAAIAIDNARLHDRVQRLAIVEERERIGKDLHDGIIQSLYAVGLTLEDVPELMSEDPADAAARVDRAIESLNLTIRDIRNFIFGLRPDLLAHADIHASLIGLADEFRLNTLIDLELDYDEEAAHRLDADERMQILQITREALSNIARHSRATSVRIELREDVDGIRLLIVDNGRGFDPSTPRGPSHQGIRNMRARATALGGEMIVESARGSGTRIIVRLPPVPVTPDTTAPGARASRAIEEEP
jgi:signal transduction histidine kinase